MYARLMSEPVSTTLQSVDDLATSKTQLAHHGRLRHVLLCKGCQDALDVRPLFDDQRIEGLARRLYQAIGIVAWMAEAYQSGPLLDRIVILST